MRKIRLLSRSRMLSGVLLLALTLGWTATPALAGPEASDFALLDMETTVADVSVQCGATKASSRRPMAFTMHITMTNRGDLGGVAGFVRTTYLDTDFVDYAIPVGTTVQISLAGGGTPGVDDAIKVTGVGGAVLIGQASIILHTDGKPHPLLGGSAFCTTTPAGEASPF